jgi:hypothetical protein
MECRFLAGVGVRMVLLQHLTRVTCWGCTLQGSQYARNLNMPWAVRLSLLAVALRAAQKQGARNLPKWFTELANNHNDNNLGLRNKG